MRPSFRPFVRFSVTRPLAAAVLVVGLLGVTADVASAALAGSGYSGTLSSNKAIRKQQLICDPDLNGAPLSGSTSVTYDPSIVGLSGMIDGPGYFRTFAQVAVQGEGGAFLQDLDAFLEAPGGQELGYVRVNYSQPSTLPPLVTLSSVTPLATGGPGQLSPPSGYAIVDEDGVAGFDTHALFFDYREGVSDGAVAAYKIFAAKQNEFFGNDADFMTGRTANGGIEILGPGDLSSATVMGSLNAVPLPPAAWAGAATMGVVGLGMLRRRLAM